MVASLALLVTILPCMAEVPVLYGGETAAAVNGVAVDAGVPAWDLDPLRLSELFPSKGTIAVGGKAVAPCATPTTNGRLREALTRSDGRVAYQQFEEARPELSEAVASLACLSEPAESSMVARLLFLQGIVAQSTGDREGAQAAFIRAFSFSPSLQWDDAFPPDESVIFSQARVALANAGLGSILLGPGVPSTLWIDGRVQQVSGNTVSVPAGTHVVQLLEGAATRTIELVVSKDASVALVNPEGLTDSLLTEASDPARQVFLDLLIEGALQTTTAYVWTEGRTWRAAETWELLPTTASEGPFTRALKTGLRPGSFVAVGIGSVTMLAGSVLYFPNKAPEEPGSTEENDVFKARMLSKGAGLGLLYGGFAVTVAGGAGLGVSLVAKW